MRNEQWEEKRTYLCERTEWERRLRAPMPGILLTITLFVLKNHSPLFRCSGLIILPPSDSVHLVCCHLSIVLHPLFPPLLTHILTLLRLPTCERLVRRMKGRNDPKRVRQPWSSIICTNIGIFWYPAMHSTSQLSKRRHKQWSFRIFNKREWKNANSTYQQLFANQQTIPEGHK